MQKNTCVEKKQSRAEDCCLLLATEFIYATLLWKKKNAKKCIANKQDLWKLHHAMRFIKEKSKHENPTTVDFDPVHLEERKK